jgi:hypothetical protein
MLTTKYTYTYRAVGALACGLVLIGIFLPWAAITDGKIGPFPAGSNASGWDLAYKQQLSGSTLNIGGAIFAAVFGLVIFAVIGLVALLAGRNGASFCYYLIASSVFFLLFMLALLPYVQQSIPVPPDPFTPEKQQALDQLNQTDPAAGSQQYSEMMKIVEERNTILQWKNLKMVPQFGFYISLAGSVLAYVLSRFIVSDTARLDNWRKYQALLAQVHADGKVTVDEENILIKERHMLRISKKDHELIIRKTIPDPALQERLLAMHDAPIDIEHVLRSREFETYKKSLIQAYADGKLTQDESDLLRTQREGLGITDADHDAMLEELVMSGAVVLSGPRPGKPGASSGHPDMTQPGPKVPPLPGGPRPSAPTAAPQFTPLPDRPILYSAPPAGKGSAPEPGPSGPISLLSSKPAVAPPPAPPAAPVPPTPCSMPPDVSEESSGPPPIPPPEEPSKVPVKKVKCTRCGELIPVYTEDRPLELLCPKCGFKGTLRK